MPSTVGACSRAEEINKQRAMLVDVLLEAFLDPGSIPGTSTICRRDTDKALARELKGYRPLNKPGWEASGDRVDITFGRSKGCLRPAG